MFLSAPSQRDVGLRQDITPSASRTNPPPPTQTSIPASVRRSFQLSRHLGNYLDPHDANIMNTVLWFSRMICSTPSSLAAHAITVLSLTMQASASVRRSLQLTSDSTGPWVPALSPRTQALQRRSSLLQSDVLSNSCWALLAPHLMITTHDPHEASVTHTVISASVSCSPQLLPN